ncbi:MAG TPA: TaqI-like C-terminal specificity domain-containing protein [Pyrinomonadaceae bacterium]|jgi:hypothetical protein
MPHDSVFLGQIKDNLHSFGSGDLKQKALQFLKTLGYESDKQIDFRPNTVEVFKSFLHENSVQSFNDKKAHTEEWQAVDFLFQLTDEEISRSKSLFDSSRVDVSEKSINSYIFFAIKLKKDEYRRTDLAEITREINRAFPMPVLILFQHGETLTFSIIDRRRNRREESRDVLLKVTLIKDIRLENPHRAHLEILADLALDNLEARNFVELHNAWQKVLDTKELNKKFFQELANWYFWAVDNVTFPVDEEKNEEVRNATGVIRLITRLIFVWFLKEKGLVSDKLFDERYLRTILRFQDESAFYKAILQNLFFATLNSEIGKREFRKDGFQGKSQHYGVHNVFRYKSEFVKPEETIRELFEPIPFLNGGLFECLDKESEVDGTKCRVSIDGFSDHHKNVLQIPDELFFGSEREYELNEIYGTRNKRYKVRGLINLLNSYKFTIAENTPIEEEIALDPELLGKVFENLLASYNPETKTTARKQTGSFYTPREIVNYMVDESLIAYLKAKLQTETEGFAGYVAFGENQATMFGNQVRKQFAFETTVSNNRWHGKEEELETALRDLFSYTEDKHPFNELETEILIKAIDNCNILDPACGSGAFPMGILHRLVHLLGKLDKNNEKWREWQEQKAIEETKEAYKIGDESERKNRLLEINEVFTNNANDYGRKLYLIENCIYGVDIQPIAIQIAKLRFFISLIVDQKANSEKGNLGIRPLPNLETKFVSANTLISLEAQGGLKPMRVNDLEKELKEVRAKHFSARTRRTKEKYREKDKEIRLEIAELLKQGGIRADIADQITKWNPYDQNALADWFDAEYMFGIEKGFDVVIGNPPYVSHDKILNKTHIQRKYDSYEPFADIYCYFFENGVKLLKQNGILTFITSNSYLRAEYGSLLRKWFRQNSAIRQVINIDDSQVFESAIVNVAILMVQREKDVQDPSCFIVDSKISEQDDFQDFIEKNKFGCKQTDFDGKVWDLAKPEISQLRRKIESKGKTLESLGTKIRLGIATGDNNAFIIDEAGKNAFILANPKNAEIIKPTLRGRDINRYSYESPEFYILLTKNGIDVQKDYPDLYDYFDSLGNKFKSRGAKGQHWTNLRACAFFDDFKEEKIIWIELTDNGRFALCSEEIYLLNTAYFLLPPNGFNSRYLLGILNSILIKFYLTQIAATSGMGVSRWINNYVKEFPVPKASTAYQDAIAEIVDKIIEKKKADAKADTFELEEKIDNLVFDLYELTEAEKNIVRGKG